MTINQGDVYWLQPRPGVPHPHVVIQVNTENTKKNTVQVCALTSNVQRANMPGNVLLNEGEGNLDKESVVEVSKVFTVNKGQLNDYIGSLSEARIDQTSAGRDFIEKSFFVY